MFGLKQSGDDNYRLADIYTDQEIMQKAKAAVTEITEDDPELDRDEDQRLRRMLLRFMEKGSIM